jgi:20S proteasome alpha/beta subunit
MTVVIAINCQDGVVIATDSMITNSIGSLATAETKGKKLYELPNNHLCAFAGDQALAARFRGVVEHGVIPQQAQGSAFPLDYVTNTTFQMIQHFNATSLTAPYNLNCILAFDHRGSHQCCFFDSAMQPRLLDADHYWTSLGSGKQYADPFMAFLTGLFCDKQPTTGEAEFLATWALDHVIETNTGGVNGPIRVATLIRQTDATYKVEFLAKEGIDQQMEAIEDAKKALVDWRNLIGGKTVDDSFGLPPTANPRSG